MKTTKQATIETLKNNIRTAKADLQTALANGQIDRFIRKDEWVTDRQEEIKRNTIELAQLGDADAAALVKAAGLSL